MLNVNIKKTILFSDYKAEFFLLIATILWGGTFPVIKHGLEWLDPFLLIFLRFFIAFMILSFLVLMGWIKIKKNLLNLSIIFKSLVLGAIGFFSYFTQTYGLLYTTPHRSAFITQLLIIFVYIFQFILLKKMITRYQWLSLGLILLGSYILFFGFRLEDPLFTKTFKGDFYTFLCAIGFAIYIILVDFIKQDEFFLVLLYHFFFIFIFSSFFLFVYPVELQINSNVVFSVGYLSILATLLTSMILFYYQPQTTPVRASIIYALEPVFASIFAIIFLSVNFTMQEFIGSLTIFLGSLIGEMLRSK